MFIKTQKIYLAALSVFLLTGCLHRELVISSPASKPSSVQTPYSAPVTSVNTAQATTPLGQNANVPAVSSVTPVGSVEPVVTPIGSTVPVASSAPSRSTVTPSYDGSKVKRMQFPAQEYAGLQRDGTGVVKGEIYAQDTYGKKIYGQQTKLYLNPVTSYSREWYSQSYIGGRSMEKADKRLFNYLKFTQSNSKGQFAFFGIPSGSYYLIGTVTMSNGKNLRIAKEVSVKNGQTVRVNLDKMSN